MKERKQLATKILSIILIIVFIFPIIAPLKSNASTLTVTMDSDATEIKTGQAIYVNIYVTGNAISGFSGYLEYDTNIFNAVKTSNFIVPEELKDNGYGYWNASYTSDIRKVTLLENDGDFYTIPNGGLLLQVKLVAKANAANTTIKLKTVQIDEENHSDVYEISEMSTTIPKAAPATYSITYNQNTADTVNNMPSAGQKTHGTNYTIPSTVPTRTGYTFAGWTTNSSGTGTNYPAGGSYTIDADATFYANWTAKQATLTVNPNGGTWDGSSSTQTFTQNYNSTKTINNPTRTPNGHIVRFNTNGGTSTDSLQQVQTTVFTGWNKTGGGSLSSTTYTFGDSNGTLTAQYEGQAITLPNATKTGATLKGWYTSQTGGTPVGGAGASWTPSSDTTLFAQWNEVDYTLTVNPNGGTWNGSPATQNVTGKYESTTTVSNPTAPNGYVVTLNNDGTTSTVTQTKTFTAWTLSGKGKIDGTTYTFGDGNGTLTAQYTPNSVTLPTLTKTGYTFDGWYTASTGGNKVTSPYTPTNNVTLYARWTANKYTITFDGKGVAVTPSTKQVTYGQTYGTLPAPTKSGYTFNGWYKDDGSQVQETDTVDITGNTKLTAKWSGAEYTVTFDPDGGNVNPTNKKVNNEDQYGELPIPTKTGYTFDGWYKDGTKIENTTKVETTTDITLKAKWIAIKSTLTVNPNGGTWDGSSAAQTFTQDYNTAKTINNPSKNADGYKVTFDGNGGTAQTGSITQTTTFTGWTLSGKGSFGGTTYTFGDGNGTLTANYSGENITLPNATKTGATLKGWYTSTTGGSPVGSAGDNWKPSADTTLYAQWNETNYTLTVDPNGGTWNGSTVPQTVTGTYNSAQQIANPTAPNGYTVTLNNEGTTTQITQTKTFTGWTSSGKGSISNTTYTFGDGNGTITAQYTGDNVTLQTPTKEGYTFDGWYTASTGGNKVNTPYKPTNDITLYARWTANQYKITFDADGGNVTPSTKQVTYDQKYGELPTPTKTGYTFEGWFMDDSTQITSNDTVKITEDKTLKAHWKGATYTLTVDPNGGTWNGSSAQQTVTGTYNATKTIANPTATSGYTVTLNNDGTTTQITQTKTFTGWTSSGKGSISDTTYTFGDGDGTITAQYTGDNVTLQTPTKAGYTFDGWYTTSTGGDKVDTSYKPTNDITLYARWTANQYTITFDADGGNVTPSTKQVTYGTTYGELPTPTKTGYTFEGWFIDESTQITSSDTVKTTEDKTLKAHWKGATYTLTVDPNGGTWNGSSAQQTVTGTYNATKTIANPTAPSGYTVTLNNDGTTTQITQTKTFTGWTSSGKGSISDTTYTFGDGDGTITAQYKDDDVTLPEPTKTGYTFDGWYTATTGGSKVGTPYKPTKNETLYARWNANKYKITFDGNGATGIPASKDVTYGEKYGELPTPTKDGYEFDGWYKDDGKKITEDDIVDIKEETKLTAGWLGAEYTVNFDADGGNTSVSSKKVKNGGKYGELPIPTKEGHTFVGWYDEDDNKIESTTTANISSDVTLKAKYEKNKYTVTFKNDDGNTLYTTVIEYEDKAEYSGKTPTSTIDTPGYESKFKGWDNQTALDKVTGDTTVTATYELSPIKYKISYNNIKDSDNSQNPTSYTIEDKNITLKDLEDKENSKFLGWYDKAVGGNKITSIDTSKLENIIVYAQWESDELYLKSEKYKIGENDIDNYEKGDIYLDKIEPNTTLKDFIANCDTNGIITVIDSEGKEISEDELVGTGMTMKVKRNDEEITLTLVVMGDLDGNGKVTAVDLSTLNQAVLKIVKLSGAEYKAADLDDNKKLTATDLSTINDTILENIKLTYTKNTK